MSIQESWLAYSSSLCCNSMVQLLMNGSNWTKVVMEYADEILRRLIAWRSLF